MNTMYKLGCGLIISCCLGLSGCLLDDEGAAPDDYSTPSKVSNSADNTSNDVKPVQKSYASKDPVQKSTPGPKRAAAPQIPVL